MFGEDRLVNVLASEDAQLPIDEVYLAGDEAFIHVSVLGEAARNNAYSPQDLQDIALGLLFEGDSDRLRHLTKWEFTGDGDCGIYVGNRGSQTVSCDEPHDFQTYATQQLPDGSYPWNDDDFNPCYSLFAEETGTPIFASGLWNRPIFPSESDWNDGYRDLHCHIEFPIRQAGELVDLDFASGFGGSIPWSEVTAETCVEGASAISRVAVQTVDCASEQFIDILDLVDPADGNVDAQCNELIAAAGYESGFAETSDVLQARGFDLALCYADIP